MATDQCQEALKVLRRGIHQKLIVGYGEVDGKVVVLPRMVNEDQVLGQTSLLSKIKDLVGDQVQLREDDPHQGFSFLGTTLRVGARIRRGDLSGDSGTLGLPLKDAAGKKYFLAAGHIVSNYWKAPGGIVERFTSSTQTEFLGNVINIWPARPTTSALSPRGQLDIGVIESDPEFDLIDETTCGFAIGPDTSVMPGNEVRKCGFSTGDKVAKVDLPVAGIGVDHGGKTYFFEDQIHLTAQPESRFAEQGDSGAVLVEKESGGFVGMLFAADLGRGRYLMAPARALRVYWESLGLGITRL